MNGTIRPVEPALTTALVLLALGTTPAASQTPDVSLPPDAEHAIEALNASPRHGEWAMVRLPQGDSVRTWVVYPERRDAAPVVVVIHEIFGLTHWVRAVADRVAANGYIAIAPDLLTGVDVPTGAEGDPERQAAVAAIRGLDVDAVQRQVRAAAEYAMALPAAKQEYAIMGFCWGGSTTFLHATRYRDIAGAVVFYGTSPDSAALARVQAPVLGLYGGDDSRVNATVPTAQAVLGERFMARTFEGAGHAFMRQLDGRDGANLRAARRAWALALGFIAGVTGPGPGGTLDR